MRSTRSIKACNSCAPTTRSLRSRQVRHHKREYQAMIHRSPLPDVEIPDVLLSDLVLRHAADLPDKPALIDGPTGRALTFAEFDAAVRRFAGGLAARGFGPGDVLAIMAPNVPEYAVVLHG